MKTSIGVLNKSNQVTDSDARLMTRACQIQLRRDVAPAYGYAPWNVNFYRSRSELPKHCIAIVIFDHADEPDTLGYHYEDEHGRQYGRVFVDPSFEAGGTVLGTGDSVSVTLSHEVIEAYTDPDINMWAEGSDDIMWAYEVCDPVETTSYRIKVRKRFVGVSNFVFASWFDLQCPKHIQKDYLKVTKKPFQLAQGGSAVTWDGKQVNVKYRRASKSRKERKNHHLARTHRRHLRK